MFLYYIPAGIIIFTQVVYFLGFIIMLYFFLQPVNWVDMSKLEGIKEEDYPHIILFYPVLRELEETMRTTLVGISQIDYPKSKFRVIAVPNKNDFRTINYLKKLQADFPFITILRVPSTQDESWNVVWEEWEKNPKAYWWHRGKYAHDRKLPPKKTRQLVYAFYQTAFRKGKKFLLNYIDADSIPPRDHFLAAAAGYKSFDVLQSTNIAGNLLDTWPASFHTMDHMAWDGLIYPHLSANGKHPFWVLGKGLFYKSDQLYQLGSFNPWLTIEDPEIGMRLWANGKKIGMIESPLIEEVPLTIAGGITQRKRWVCGFFQSLNAPLKIMGMSFFQRLKARLNIVPCLFLLVNVVGLPAGIWMSVEFFRGNTPVATPWLILSVANLFLYFILLIRIYVSIWKRSRIVLQSKFDRVRYMFRINPLFLWIYWTVWTIPIWIGFVMFIQDSGKEWDRTEKVDANHNVVRRYETVKAVAKN